MAEQKRVTRRGTRAMMRPKPPRVVGRDPFKPLIQGHQSAFVRRNLHAVGLTPAGVDYWQQAQLYMINDCEVV